MCEILFLYFKECWKKGRKRRIPFCPFLFLCAHRCTWLASSSSLVVIGTREQHLRGFPLRFPLRCSRHAASLLHLPPNSSALFFPPFFLIFFLIFSFVCLTTKIPAACSVSSCPFSPSLLLLLLLLLCFSSGPLCCCFCFHAGFVKTGLGTIIVLFVFACLLASTEICRLANLEGANWRELRTSERGF